MAKLLKRRHRQEQQLFLIEEGHLIEEAWSCRASIEAIVVKQGCWDNLPSVVAPHDSSQLNYYELSPELFEDLVSTETSRGVMAVVAIPHTTPEDVSTRGRSKNLLILDRLQDPGNVGTLIRTADAAGFGGVIMIKGTCDCYAPKVVRSTAGSLFRIPILHVPSAQEAFDLAHAQGAHVAVTSLDDACIYTQADLSKPIAFVVGNEGQGVSDECLRLADLRLTIPMFGSIESLNAAIAGALVMYEAHRQQA